MKEEGASKVTTRLSAAAGAAGAGDNDYLGFKGEQSVVLYSLLSRKMT